MAQRSIGLSIQILNIEELTKFENRINELNKKGIKLNVTGLDKLDNIQNLINNIDKVKTQLDTIAKSGILNQEQIKSDNQQIDEIKFSSVNEWFDNFYTSIVEDLIIKAKEDFEFEDKYNNLSTDEQDELKEDVQNYILNSKSDVVENLQSKDNDEDFN